MLWRCLLHGIWMPLPARRPERCRWYSSRATASHPRGTRRKRIPIGERAARPATGACRIDGNAHAVITLAFYRGKTMATLNIRNLPDAVHANLRLRAARAGRSMEAEAREILAQACRPEPDGDDLSALQGLVDSLYGADKPSHVVEDLIADRRREAQGE